MSNMDDIFEAIGSIKGDVIKLKTDLNNTNALRSIQKNLDIIFPDAECKMVTLTENTDKPFFGVVVMPILSSEQVMDITISDKNFLINKYKVELDSKLFGNFIGLSFDEIESFIIHEVGVLVSSDTPARRVRMAIDTYLSNTMENLKISDYISYIDLLSFGIKNAICKSISVFYNEYTEPADLDRAYDLTEFIKSGMSKIKSFNDIWTTTSETGSNAMYTIIKWTLRLYRDILTYRIVAIHQLKKGMDLTASKYHKIEMSNLIYRLEKIDDLSLIRESVSTFIDKKKKALDSMFTGFKKNGIKYFADNYYELKLRMNNMDDSRSEAFSILHSINSRISVLNDYLETEENLTTNDARKITDLINKYEALRDEISNKKMKSPQTLLIGLDGYYDNE